jgi:hypothetical protein
LALWSSAQPRQPLQVAQDYIHDMFTERLVSTKWTTDLGCGRDECRHDDTVWVAPPTTDPYWISRFADKIGGRSADHAGLFLPVGWLPKPYDTCL